MFLIFPLFSSLLFFLLYFLLLCFRKIIFLPFFPFRLQVFFFAVGRNFFFAFLKKQFRISKKLSNQQYKQLSKEQIKRKFKQSRKDKLNQEQENSFCNSLLQENFGLTFRHSLGIAAGFDKDGDLLNFQYQVGAGFGMVGTVLNKPHTGNLYSFFGKKVNVWLPLDQSRSAINSLGLPSVGIDKVIGNIKKFRQSFVTKKNPHGVVKNFPIAISLMGHPLQKGQQKLNGVLESIEKVAPLIDIIEINESCPNVSNDINAPNNVTNNFSNSTILNLEKEKETKSDQIFVDRIEQICNAVVKANKKNSKKIAIFIKFADLQNISFLIDVLDNYNIQAITISNTLKNYSSLEKNIHPSEKKNFQNYTKNYLGGVSGKAIWQSVIESEKELHKAISIKKSNLKIIHCGGIYDSNDLKIAKEKSVLQQWYTGFIDNYLKDKNVYEKILKNLKIH